MMCWRQSAALLWAIAGLSSFVSAQSAKGEPSGTQILMGAWVDTADDGVTPLDFNQRVGQNMSVFQIAQNMPLPAYDWVTGEGGPAPAWLIDQTQTTASVFLTVYPTTFSLSAADYSTLGSQLKNYTDTTKRTTFLRFAPEMQGTWFSYGFQPVAYKAMWIDMYTQVKKIAPDAIIVWAPNEGFGYPYGQTQTNATELAALDTDNDGAVSDTDDPFSPYYPGDDYVDWIGMSMYYKGPNYGDNVNEAQADTFCTNLIQNINPITNVAGTNFYTQYCEKAGKACMISESGAAYHVDIAGGATQLAIQTAWWESCMFNDALFDQFPRLKLWMHFEYEKTEDGDDLRDYRMANTTSILNPFSSALEAFATRVSWAETSTLPANIPASGVPPAVTGGSTSSVCSKWCGQVTFHTDRNPATGAPSLFGSTRSSGTRLQATIAVGVTSFAMMGAMFWLSGRSARHGVSA